MPRGVQEAALHLLRLQVLRSTTAYPVQPCQCNESSSEFCIIAPHWPVFGSQACASDRPQNNDGAVPLLATRTGAMSSSSDDDLFDVDGDGDTFAAQQPLRDSDSLDDTREEARDDEKNK
eukprot:COSAG06_NODE_20131_length_806_cov_201.957567_1_plen_119_part_10